MGLVLPSEKFKLRHETDYFLEKNRIQPEVCLESDILSVVVRAVVDGVGVGLLPHLYLRGELQSGSVVQIFPQAKFWNHKLFMISRPSENLHPFTEEMVKVLRLPL